MERKKVRLYFMLLKNKGKIKGVDKIKIMAKVTAYIPEPKQEYEVDNQRQILESLLQ